MSTEKPRLDDLRIERLQASRTLWGSWFAVAVVVILLLAGLAVWSRLKPAALEVRTAAARGLAGNSGDRTVLHASGYVTARRAATVSSKVTGKVVEVLVEEGFKVNEGQILARLDDTNVKASLHLAEAQAESARSALEETRARLHQAELEWKRAAELAKSRIASKADLDRAEAEARALRARLEQQEKEVTVAERQVALWQQQLEDTIIRAPFSGIVTSKDAQPGEMISPVSAGGGFTRTGICTLVDMESLEVEIDVNESYINRVQAGQPVLATLDAYPDWKIPCKVIATIPTADRQKSTVRVRVGFDQLDPRVLPEMSVKVAFRETDDASLTVSAGVAVPRAAVRRHGGMDILMVVEDGRVRCRVVTVTSATQDESVVDGSIVPGERVVIGGPAELADGARVKEVKP